MKSICVYCVSCFGTSPEYQNTAEAFGTTCARRGLALVYGGGNVGLMGTVANAALAAGGKVIGIIPRSMVAEERAHRGLTELIIVDTMHERKYRMAQLSDAFVALPGGIGTLEEVIEAFTWLQLGLHLKPVALLNVSGFFDSLLQFLAQMRDQGFLTGEHHAMLAVASDVESLLDALTTTQHGYLAKPIEHTRIDQVKPASKTPGT